MSRKLPDLERRRIQRDLRPVHTLLPRWADEPPMREPTIQNVPKGDHVRHATTQNVPKGDHVRHATIQNVHKGDHVRYATIQDVHQGDHVRHTTTQNVPKGDHVRRARQLKSLELDLRRLGFTRDSLVHIKQRQVELEGHIAHLDSTDPFFWKLAHPARAAKPLSNDFHDQFWPALNELNRSERVEKMLREVYDRHEKKFWYEDLDVAVFGNPRPMYMGDVRKWKLEEGVGKRYVEDDPNDRLLVVVREQ